MPRKPRMYIPGIPCHVIQRGNNRNACFFTEADYRFYLDCLQDACINNHVDIHAYVQMTNHVHMLLTPDSQEGISRVMQSLGRRYVQYINKTYKRCGTLWESRHKASLVDAEHYLLACYRYIELNPVAAQMVDHPGAYRWSSYSTNAYGKPNKLITPHQVFLQLGTSAKVRQEKYRKLFSLSLGKEEIHAIRTATQFSTPLGNKRFKERIEKATGQKVGQPKLGRPFKTQSNGIANKN
jgi:REP-associated tyrosine transposase